MTQIHRFLSGIMAVGLIIAVTSFAAAQDDEIVPAEEPAPEAPAARVVDMAMSDFKLEPATLSLPSGPVSFAIRNVGVIDHNLAIENSQRQILATSASFPAGRSGTFDLTLLPGNYTMVCTLPAHREAGMIGTLTVTQ